MRQGRLFGPRTVGQAPVDAHAPTVALLIHGLDARSQRLIRRQLEAHAVHVGGIDDHGQVHHGPLADRDGHRGGEGLVSGFDDLGSTRRGRPLSRLTDED